MWARTSLGLLLLVVSACRIPVGSDNDSSTPKSTTTKTTGANGGTGTGPVAPGTNDDPQGESDSQEEAPTRFTGTAIRPGDTDNGAADETTPFRTLFNLPMLKINELISAVHDMHTPGSATFRQYVSADAVNSTYMPAQASVDAVSAWIAANGMKVERVATNRMLIQVSGTIGAFNKAFATTVHKIKRGTNDLYATPTDDLAIPTALVGKLDGVLTLDQPAATGSPDQVGNPVDTKPPADGPATVAFASMLYGADKVDTHGAGETIVIVGAGAVRKNDAQSFWQSQSITRADFTVNQVAEGPAAVNTESTLDVEWSGGMAPDANVILYQAPDTADSALVFAFNEAVAKGEATVINDSFSHNEALVPIQVRVQYDRSALAAAAQGITVISSSGDTSQVDAPGSSPYVLSVGGATLGNSVWNGSGGGQSSSFALPDWQKGVASGADHRACPDIAALADNLWYYSNGYQHLAGTSFSSPLTAGLFATLNSIRTKAGKPRIGWFNSVLYTTPAVQATFQDVTAGVSGNQRAAQGWDYTTGWGAPTIPTLADAIP